jgi:hypothetical protein
VSALSELIQAADRALAPYAVADPGPGRFTDVPGDRAFVLEAVYEGYLMHYGEPRAFERMDPDLRLLAGDALYALGLARLAAAGDLVAVAALANLISESAQAQVEGRPEDAEALWEAIGSRARSCAP